MSKGRSSFPAPQKEPSSFLLQNGHGVETFSAAKLSKVQDFCPVVLLPNQPMFAWWVDVDG